MYEFEDCVAGVDLPGSGIIATPGADNCIQDCEVLSECTGFAFAGGRCYFKNTRCEDTPEYNSVTDTYLNKGSLFLYKYTLADPGNMSPPLSWEKWS